MSGVCWNWFVGGLRAAASRRQQAQRADQQRHSFHYSIFSLVFYSFIPKFHQSHYCFNILFINSISSAANLINQPTNERKDLSFVLLAAVDCGMLWVMAGAQPSCSGRTPFTNSSHFVCSFHLPRS